MTYGEFMELCLELCIMFDCSMTSGMRTEKRNARIGGSPTSKHVVNDEREGWGQDLVPDLREDYGYVVEAAHGLGLGALDEGDHVHVQYPRKGQPF